MNIRGFHRRGSRLEREKKFKGRRKLWKKVKTGVIATSPLTQPFAIVPMLKRLPCSYVASSNVHTFGLIARNNNPLLATSLDGIVRLRNSNSKETENFAVQIKTKSSDDELSRMKDFVTCYGCVSECKFGDFVFKNCIPQLSYRAQLLYHAAILGLNNVAFVTASKKRIVHVLVVKIGDQVLNDKSK